MRASIGSAATEYARDQAAVLLDTRLASTRLKADEGMWSGPLPPHSLGNVGDAERRVIMVEVKVA